MKTAKIEYEDVDYPINAETINKLGEENGISMYIIQRLNQHDVLYWFDEFLKPKTEVVESISVDTMKIDQAASGWIATINGHFYYDFRGSKIIKICKLEF